MWALRGAIKFKNKSDKARREARLQKRLDKANKSCEDLHSGNDTRIKSCKTRRQNRLDKANKYCKELHPKNEKNRDSCVCKLLKGYQSCDTKNKQPNEVNSELNSKDGANWNGARNKDSIQRKKEIQIDDRTKRQILRKQV